jgi:hypothetical protein
MSSKIFARAYAQCASMDWEFFALLTFLALLFLGPMLLRERTKRAGFDLIARALERGHALDPDTILRITEEKLEGDRRRSTLAIGVVLVALAVAAVVAGLVLTRFESDAPLQNFLVPAVIIGGVGAGFLLLAALDRAGPRG